jgi:hypothetical protein
VSDQSAAVWRPSPRARPAGAPSRPGEAPRLRVVPEATLQPTLQSEPAIGEDTPRNEDPQVNASEIPDGTETATSVSARIRAFTASSRAYWTAPSIFTDRPASLEELAAYAKRAPWTHQQTGIIRSFGIGWYRFVAYPYTVKSRYQEWFVQRPLRLAALVGGIKLLSLTGPGDWVVHTVVYPAAQLAGHIFL